MDKSAEELLVGQIEGLWEKNRNGNAALEKHLDTASLHHHMTVEEQREASKRLALARKGS